MRDVLVDSELGNENLRKLMSGDNTGADTGDDQKASDGLMSKVYKKLKLSFDIILKNHGLYAPFRMNNNLQYIITLPPVSKIMKAQQNEAIKGYTLEYETMDNADLVVD
jgi:hypothetical protein